MFMIKLREIEIKDDGPVVQRHTHFVIRTSQHGCCYGIAIYIWQDSFHHTFVGKYVQGYLEFCAVEEIKIFLTNQVT